MANSARKVPGAQSESISDVNPLDDVQGFYENNKKTISTVITVVLVAVVGYFGYTKMYMEPKQEKAATAMAWAQQNFQMDSLNLALNGDGRNPGFNKIASSHSGTPAGNLAHYYAGICNLKMGDFAKAISELQAFDGKGTLLGRQAKGALGQAYMESGNSAKAIESYKAAIAGGSDKLITPMYLYQLALAYDAAGQANEAKDAFKRIRDEFPNSPQARDIAKELARVGELN